jgi:hypothetical protein
MVMVALDLTTNLILDPLRFEEEKLVAGPMLSQYPPMTSHMARGHRETHHLLTRTILRMENIIKMKLLPP